MKIIWLILGSLLFGLVPILSTAGSTYVIPKELAQYGAKNNCDQYSEFFNSHSNSRYSPYVYAPMTYSHDEQTKTHIPYGFDSAAFWCKKNGQFTLLFKFNREEENGNKGLGRCSDSLNNVPEYYVNGLRYSSSIDVGGKEIYEFQTKKKLLMKPGIKVQGIISLDEGAGAEFYCYKRKWYFSPFD